MSRSLRRLRNNPRLFRHTILRTHLSKLMRLTIRTYRRIMHILHIPCTRNITHIPTRPLPLPRVRKLRQSL